MLVIDIGNTRTKWGIWQDNILTVGEGPMPEAEKIGYAAVGEVPAELAAWLHRQNAFRVTGTTPGLLPNHYKTPETLGADRWCAINAAFAKGAPVLVIDIGTALTVDIAASAYEGGTITPGAAMRLKALNAYTDKLPRLNMPDRWTTIGMDTENAILSGVMQGMVYELNGHIRSARMKWPDIQVFLTGGDAATFEKHLETVNFVAPNLVLEGIARLTTHNSA